MQRLPLILIVLAIGGGVWLFFNRGDDDAGDELPVNERDDTARTENPTMTGAQPGDPDTAEPELKELTAATRALFIGASQDSWTATVLLTMFGTKKLEYRSWFHVDVKTRKPTEGEGRGMSRLDGTPTGDYLNVHDVQALFIDAIDPHVLGDEFWAVVSERVLAGKMGMVVRPRFPVNLTGGEMPNQHPMMTHAVLMSLLPIKSAALLEGTPPAGVYTKPRPVTITPEGLIHPATFLVDNEIASARAWSKTATGDGKFETAFCYPVQELHPGAKTLLTVEAATPVPAIVVGKSDVARVLWMGNADFGRRVYFSRPKEMIMKSLLNGWLLWMARQQ